MMDVLNKAKLVVGRFLFPDFDRAVVVHEALKTLVFARGDTGGVVKRVDENRELLEVLLRDAPDLMKQSPWIVGWIKANDSFFISAADIVSQGRGGAYAARPWPVHLLKAMFGANNVWY
jgi:hypothetical protein